MITINPVTSDKCQVTRTDAHANRVTRAAFSMVELLVAMTLLSLIVLALMAVFSSTQQAFRASVTQTGILEGGRAAMDMIASDLRAMTPSGGQSNYIYGGVLNSGAMNLFVTNNDNQYPPYPGSATTKYIPLKQPLPGTSASRTNLLQWFFVLGRVNTKWTGTGYIVNSATNSPLYPLYRFYAETNISAPPVTLFQLFQNDIYYGQWTNMSHVMDGVVHLVVRAYDANGYWLTNEYRYYTPYSQINPPNVWFSPPEWGEVGYHFYSNSVPASVEVQLGVLEDRTLQRAESLGIVGQPPPDDPAQWAYLQGQSGHVQLFRQRVTIPNLDPSVYP